MCICMWGCVHEEVRKQLSGGHFSAFYHEFGGHTKVIGLKHQRLNLLVSTKS